MEPKFSLDTDTAYQLAELMTRATDKKVSRRLLAISLRHFGYPIEEIAQICSVSERSVTNWLRLFKEKGLAGVSCLSYPSDRGSRLESHQVAIMDKLMRQPDIRIGELQAWLARERGVDVEFSWLYRYVTKRRKTWEKQAVHQQSA